jgi:acyl-CoA synthetase (NDP forming)
MTHPLDAFFNPRTIAVVGASNTPGKIGAAPLGFLLQFGFDGVVVPIHPVEAQVQGRPAWPSLQEAVKAMGHGIDLAIVAVPAALTPKTLLDAAGAGVRNLVLFSSGFGETGADGARAQRELARLAEQLGLRLLGPNCLGFMSPAHHVYATFSPVLNAGRARPGPIAIVSQSGAFGAFAYSLARERGVGLSHWITTGNEANLTLADCIEWLAQDAATGIIMCYIEGVRDGARLKQALAAARGAGKPVVAVKVGRSELGAQAAASHTASLAGDDLAYEALFRQYGVWRARGIDEFFEVAHALAIAPVPRRAGLGVLTVSGGVGVLLADEAQARGLELPAMPAAAQQRILELVAFAAPRNPVDMTGQVAAQPGLTEQAARLMLSEGGYGSLLVFLAAAGLAPRGWDQLLELAVHLRRDFPDVALAYCCLITRERREQLEALGCLCFDEPTHAVRALAALEFFRRDRTLGAAPQVRLAAIARPELPMNEAQALAWLSAQGLPAMQHAVAASAEDAVAQAAALGYPVALKILSADILHKSEVGGVALGLRDATQVRQAFEAVLASCRQHAPQARIDGALVAPMASAGVECILGVRHDPALGALVLLGIGGVDVELLRDISVRVAPVDSVQAQSMVDQLKLAPLLRGHRGRPLADEAALVASLVRLAALGAACDGWMDSIEINPLRVLAQGSGVLALDAVVTARAAAVD